jgi:hypothetical protein
MPKPVYILCSHTASTDRFSSSLSLFNILESLRFVHQRPQPAIGTISATNFFGVAVWRRSPEDPVGLFDFELLSSSPGKEQKVVQQGTFTFDGDIQRFYVPFGIEQPWEVSGEFVFVSKVRPQGGQWLSQEYRIPVEVIPPQ